MLLAALLLLGSAAAVTAHPPAEAGVETQLSPAFEERRVRVDVRPGPECGEAECEAPTGSLRLTATGGEDGGGVRETSVSLRSWGSLDIPAPTDSGFVLELEDARYWAPAAVGTPKTGDVGLRLHPVTEVRVEVEPSREAAPPEELRVAFSSAPVGVFPPGSEALAERRAQRLEGEVRCLPGDGATAWRCRVPSGTQDLRFHAPGFATVYRWAVPLEAFGEAALPGLPLLPGGSLVGFLEVAEGELPADAEVKLLPAGERPGATGLRTLGRVAAVSERGLFQFSELAAGFYRLVVDLPGWAATEVEPLEVTAGVETRLPDPLRLQRPGRLLVCVAPPHPPGIRRAGDTWEVRLSRLSQPVDDRSGTVDANGCLELDNLEPGDYRLLLTDARGSRWDLRQVEVRSGEQRVDFDVDLFPVAGTLERDSKPIRARLDFRRLRTLDDGTREEKRVQWFVDPEGRFEGALPEPGTWYVEALLRAGGATIELTSVEIDDRPGRLQELALEVPNTSLAGRVLTADGEPADRATVRLIRKRSREDRGGDPDRPPGFGSHLQADRSGRYRFEGFPPGDYHLTAWRGGASAAAEVRVDEDVPLPGPTLVLEAMKEVRGAVIGDNGPVAGAVVVVVPDLDDRPFVGIRARHTDMAGGFRAEVPEAATSLRVLVAAVGYGARAVHVPLGDGSGPVVLRLDRFAGTLLLTAPASVPLPAGAALEIDGVFLPLGVLSFLRDVSPRGFTPRAWRLSMAPGAYRLCDSGLDQCSSGVLGPGETLMLEAPGD